MTCLKAGHGWMLGQPMAGHGGPLADYGLQWPASVYCSHPFQHDLTCAVQESQYLLRNKIGRAGGAGPFHSEFRVYTIISVLYKQANTYSATKLAAQALFILNSAYIRSLPRLFIYPETKLAAQALFILHSAMI